MYKSGLSDLDELVLKCRNNAARDYIAEAISCYKAGAYRACIVSTWVAIVYDYLGKLRDLEIAGDANARIQLANFELHRVVRDIRSLQNFETNILITAKDTFELLTPEAFRDLSRLVEDRNRCAHPSMETSEEAYAPSAELARYHLHSAIEHMLIQPPVQGKAALDRIWASVRSTTFPTNVNDAVHLLQSGPLSHPRIALVRSVVIGLTKSLLSDDSSEDERDRKFAALGAALEMHRHEGEATLAEKFEGIVAGLDDTRGPSLLRFLRIFPSAWRLMSAGSRIRTRNFVKQANATELVSAVSAALQIAELKGTGREMLASIDSKGLSVLLAETRDPAVVDAAVALFCEVGSFKNAKIRANRLIAPYGSLFSVEHVESLLEAFVSNRQIRYATGMVEVYRELFDLSLQHFEATILSWKKFLTVVDTDVQVDDDEDFAATLRQRLEEYP